MKEPDQRFWKLKRIPEGGRTHLRSIERNRENPTHTVFGQYSLEETERGERLKVADPESAKTFQVSWLHLDKKHLISFFEKGSAEQRDDIKKLIEESLNNPTALAALRQCAAVCGGDGIIDAGSVIAVLKQPDVPDVFMVTLLRAHAEKYTEYNEQVRELGEQIKEEFFDRVKTAIAAGFLSPDTDITVVRARLDVTRFFYIDPLSGGSHTSVSRSAEGLIGISHEHYFRDTPEMRRHTFFHELVHATLAGRAITASVVGGSGQIMTHAHRKEGLRFDFERAPRGQKFGWLMGLNEGVTEYIAQYLSGMTDSVAYGIQILYMRNMAEKGVLMSAFVHAYQEDYKLGENGVRRLPKLAELLTSIRTAMGENWYNSQIRQIKTDYGWGL